MSKFQKAGKVLGLQQGLRPALKTRQVDFHAIYGEYNGVYDIQSCEIIEGDLPSRADRMVRDWAQSYQAELLDMWNTQQFKQLPGLE